MKHEYEFTNYTYCDPKYLDRRVLTADHLNFYADNCEKLADYMATVPDAKHKQSIWAFTDTRIEECGTPACALGHAAYSNVFPGLQFGINGITNRGRTQVIMPVINGGKVSVRKSKTAADWIRAGRYFFGAGVTDGIFGDYSLSKQGVIDGLRAYAESYRLRAAVDDFDDY